MIDKRSLELNAYEYFKQCHNKRGVAVITDKQYIFYSQILKDDYRTHDNIVVDIETTIHPNSNKKDWDAFRDNNVYVFAVGPGNFRIDFPDNSELSMAQATFILELLKQVDRYNEEVEDNNKVEVCVANTRNYLKDWEKTDTSKIREVLPKMVTKKIKIEEERIIGQTLSKEQIESNLIFHIGLKDCTSIKEIISVLDKCYTYYNDSYYRDTFCEIFPNYSKLVNMKDILYNLNITNEKVQNVTFENIDEIIFNSIKNVFRGLKTYNEIKDIIFNIRYFMKEDEIKEIFQNFELFTQFIMDIFPVNEEDKEYMNNLFSNASSYEELSKIVFKLGYNKKKKELEEEENYLVSENKLLEDIRMRKEIIENKEEINKMINDRNELQELIFTFDSKIKRIEISINMEKKVIDKNNGFIEKSSDSLFKKIKNRKRIRGANDNISISKAKTEKLEIEKDDLIKKITEAREVLSVIEEKFKTITHFDFFPINESAMEFYYSQDYWSDIDESEVIKWIEILKQKIDKLRKELDDIVQNGLVIFEDESLEDSNEKNISNSRVSK